MPMSMAPTFDAALRGLSIHGSVVRCYGACHTSAPLLARMVPVPEFPSFLRMAWNVRLTLSAPSERAGAAGGVREGRGLPLGVRQFQAERREWELPLPKEENECWQPSLPGLSSA